MPILAETTTWPDAVFGLGFFALCLGIVVAVAITVNRPERPQQGYQPTGAPLDPTRKPPRAPSAITPPLGMQTTTWHIKTTRPVVRARLRTTRPFLPYQPTVRHRNRTTPS